MDSLAAGVRLGPYQLEQELGRGGMASVYRAYQPSMDRYVAVKVIRNNLAGDSVGLERFQREARLVARLEHPHILPVYDYNGSHDPPYIVMRYLAGGTLQERLRGELPTPAQTLRLVQQLASALDYAHRQGVIHRDIKPSNIMIDQDGNAFLMDFGIARLAAAGAALTQSGAIMGTPAYMAPEQGMGATDLAPAADIYSLGVVLFELLTGHPPFTADTPVAVVFKHIQETPPSALSFNAALPMGVDDVLQQALAKQPEERFASAGALAKALAAALAGGSGGTLSTATAAPLRPLPGSSAASTTSRTAGVSRMVTHVEQHRLVTVMHADWSEYEHTLGEMLDAEAVSERMARLLEIVQAQTQRFSEAGGMLIQRGGSSLTILWGVELAREDDPERAMRAALALRDSAHSLALPDLLPLQIGLASGDVLLTPITGSDLGTPGTSPFRATGAALSAAARLAAAIPEGGVVATLDTYRLVRGVFDVTPLPPLRLRGAREPLEVFLVVQAKPRAFRIPFRGVEGVDTRLIGREAELLRLQQVLETALEDQEAQLVVISGAPGSGKSRLAVEFAKWRELRPEGVWLFQGRAFPETSGQPYALLRSVLTFRFQIQETDPLAQIRVRFEEGIVQFMGPGHEADAHRIGQLLGFDFSDSPHVAPLLAGNGAGLQEAGLRSLVQFFRAAATCQENTALLIELEDAHWADDRSLDALLHILRLNSGAPLMLALLARPELLARRPELTGSSAGGVFRLHLELAPLSRRDSRRLVREVLQKVDNLGDELRDWIAERSEGNPLYIEELVKALLDDRVIVKGAQPGEPWQAHPERLNPERIPTTLNGLLQARLDGLSPDERVMLQRAAVFGRIFWRGAVTALEQADGLPIAAPELLAELARRELIFRRENSSFAGEEEFSFASNLLRDAAYESALKRLQRQYHAAAAEWLLAVAGQDNPPRREYAAVVASHYQRADLPGKAVPYWVQASEFVANRSAFREALAYMLRAVEHLDEADPPLEAAEYARILHRAGEFCAWISEYEQAIQLLERARDYAIERQLPRPAGYALTLLGLVAYYRTETEKALHLLEQALVYTEQADNLHGMALVQRQLGNVLTDLGEFERAEAAYFKSIEYSNQINDLVSVGIVHNNLGALYSTMREYERAITHLHQSIEMNAPRGNLLGKAYALNNLGTIYLETKRPEEALQAFEESAPLAHNSGSRMIESEARMGAGTARLLLGQTEAARPVILAGARLAIENQLPQIYASACLGLADLLLAEKRPTDALAIYTLAARQPRQVGQLSELIEQGAQRAANCLSPAAAVAARSAGQALSLEAALALAEQAG